MGYNFARHMTAKFCCEALSKAIAERQYPERKLMHHSDRGSQYCSSEYTQVLIKNSIEISMTENGDPLENPLTERMNRTFKDIFAIDKNFRTFTEAKTQIDNAVLYYNNRLPHSSIEDLTPQSAHLRIGKLKKLWRNYWLESQVPKPEPNAYTPQ